MIISETKYTKPIVISIGRAGFFLTGLIGVESDYTAMDYLFVIRWPWSHPIEYNIDGVLVGRGRVVAFDWRDEPVEIDIRPHATCPHATCDNAEDYVAIDWIDGLPRY